MHTLGNRVRRADLCAISNLEMCTYVLLANANAEIDTAGARRVQPISSKVLRKRTKKNTIGWPARSLSTACLGCPRSRDCIHSWEESYMTHWLRYRSKKNQNENIQWRRIQMRFHPPDSCFDWTSPSFLVLFHRLLHRERTTCKKENIRNLILFFS